MLSPSCSRAWLLVFALLAPVVPAAAAPASETRAGLAPYLIDDTDFVLVINVKQILASPLITKHYQKQLQQLLKSTAVKPWLEGTGFDPLRDVDRLILVTGRCLSPTEKEDGTGPLVYLEGRFDPEKIRVSMNKLAERMPGFLKVETRDGVKGYQVTAPGLVGFLCLLDRHTLLLAPARKDLVAEARARATGKKKPELKHKSLRPLLGQITPEQAISFVGLGEMVVYSEVRVSVDGMGGTDRKVTLHTLADEGIDSIQGGSTVTDAVTGRVTLAVQNEEQAKRMAKTITAGMDAALVEIQKGSKPEPEFWVALLNVVEGVRIRVQGRTVVLEGRVTAAKLKTFTDALFDASSRTPSAPPLFLP